MSQEIPFSVDFEGFIMTITDITADGTTIRVKYHFTDFGGVKVRVTAVYDRKYNVTREYYPMDDFMEESDGMSDCIIIARDLI